jgi:hypothetical protein
MDSNTLKAPDAERTAGSLHRDCSTACHECNRDTSGEMTWPGEAGHEICQECWEAECSRSWWEMVEQLNKCGLIEAVVRRWRVAFKLWLSKHKCIASFCKDCGRDVTDFIVPDDVWVKIEPTIKRGRVLCYDCFCEHCRQIGLPTVWKLGL